MPIDVEVDISNGMFEFIIVGLASKEVVESKKRIWSAIENSGFNMPKQRIVVNLAPADLAKSSTGLDLPIAIGILRASNQINIDTNNKYFWGELSLNGEVVNTRGVTAITLADIYNLGQEVYIPRINANQAVIKKGSKVFLVGHLRDITANTAVNNTYITRDELNNKEKENIRIIYNEKLINSLVYSVVGRHNLLAIGPAGVGKSYVLRLIEKLTHPLIQEDYYEVNRIYSIAGLNTKKMVEFPPFRAPHHSITRTGFIGGGTKFKVGEITLAHKGFLLLDEFNLFEREILDNMREPLETKQLTIQRSGYSFDLPCDFCLLATMNPCACGNYGSKNNKCKCLPCERDRYWKRINKPILDRIDIQIYVANTLLDEAGQNKKKISLSEIQREIDGGIIFRKARGKYKGIKSEAYDLIDKAAKSYELSIRGANKIRELARTIADCDQSKDVNEYHIAEAISYRVINNDTAI